MHQFVEERISSDVFEEDPHYWREIVCNAENTLFINTGLEEILKSEENPFEFLYRLELELCDHMHVIRGSMDSEAEPSVPYKCDKCKYVCTQTFSENFQPHF